MTGVIISKTMMPCPRSLLGPFLFFWLAMTTCAQEEKCPIYRAFDSSDPTAYQYLAPPGCKCVDDMTDLKCAYCLDDAPCQYAHGDDYQCREGMSFATGDTYKSYQCNLVGPFEAFFTGGKISIYANVSEGTIDLSVFNQENINFLHAADCHITGCTFPIGGANVNCESAGTYL
jgi:hypothetical protein